MAPGAAIVELVVSGTSLDSVTKAVAASVAALRLGSTLGSVISISTAGQTGGEGCDSHEEVAELHAARPACAPGARAEAPRPRASRRPPAGGNATAAGSQPS
jgi:hypothetical protein